MTLPSKSSVASIVFFIEVVGLLPALRLGSLVRFPTPHEHAAPPCSERSVPVIGHDNTGLTASGRRSFRSLDFGKARNAPQLHGLVAGAGEEPLSVGREGDGLRRV